MQRPQDQFIELANHLIGLKNAKINQTRDDLLNIQALRNLYIIQLSEKMKLQEQIKQLEDKLKKYENVASKEQPDTGPKKETKKDDNSIIKPDSPK